MAVSDSGSKGGARGRTGIQLGLIRAESVKNVIRLALGAPVCQVRFSVRLLRKLSHPLFVVLPGPSGYACVTVETWADFLAWQLLLVRFLLTFPTMGGSESTTMPVVANGGLQLADEKIWLKPEGSRGWSQWRRQWHMSSSWRRFLEW